MPHTLKGLFIFVG